MKTNHHDKLSQLLQLIPVAININQSDEFQMLWTNMPSGTSATAFLGGLRGMSRRMLPMMLSSCPTGNALTPLSSHCQLCVGQEVEEQSL